MIKWEYNNLWEKYNQSLDSLEPKLRNRGREILNQEITIAFLAICDAYHEDKKLDIKTETLEKLIESKIENYKNRL